VQVTVRYFAALRERVGRAAERLALPAGATAADALAALAQQHPALATALPQVRCAVNQEYVASDTVLHDGDELALIPPVSGGDHYRVTREPLAVEPLVEAVADPEAGCVVVFIGQPRRTSRGKQVDYLEYEAYEPMAEKKLAAIGAALRAAFGVRQVAISHRVGRLEIGEPSVVIAVAATHRAEGFAACREAIERIKVDVPVWKKEVWQDGEVWVGMEGG
jgi:molybdopterin synthase catalytic subunit